MTEFTHWIEAEEVPNKGLRLTLSPDADVRAALARRYGILGIDALEARVLVKPAMPAGILRVEGEIEADVEQSCVVTLEPVKQHVSEHFTVEFGAVKEQVDLELTLEDDDPVEPLENGGFDLGEVVAQYLALGLDPWPRAPGVSLEDQAEKLPSGDVVTLDRPSGPFAGLAALKGEMKDGGNKK